MREEDLSTKTLDPAASDVSSDNAGDGARKRRDPNEPAAVVGLGASAGGIAPLQQFFSDMKPDTGLTFVVVMHLAPEFESQLAQVIQQKTGMPVIPVTEPMKVRPNHVYVIPPNQQLTFANGKLRLVPPQQALGRRVTIDLFFRTLAQAYGQRAVCVILSGTDSDGAIGLKHIRAQGGLTIVQDPNEAEFDSMPVTAISTGMADWVLPVADMPDKLVEFVRNENRMKLPPEILEADEPDAKVRDAPGGETVSDETHSAGDEEAILKVLSDLRAQTGHEFNHYKRATVLRRIARRLQVNSLETIPQYLDFIRTHPAEIRALLQDLLIGVTHFFRDREAFAALEAHIPQLFAGKKESDEIRVWVTGCASGEEAYSIAILLCEHAARLDNAARIQIFASDIDEESIADAREGLYPSMIEADVSPERLREFFGRDQGRYRVRKEIREKVLFATQNVLKDAPFSRCDMISCRNLLIYLNPEAQKQVFEVFHFSLRSGGLLFLGGAENQGQAQSLFSSLDAKHRIFVRRSTPRSTWKMPTVPIGAVDVRSRRPIGWRPRPLPALTHDVADKAATAEMPAVQAGHTRREVLFGELHLRLLEQYGPPSVVVNETHDIVHLSQSAGRYLQFVAGEPTANITKVVIPELRIEMRTALFKAAQKKQNVKGSPTRLQIDGAAEVITLDVRPMQAGDQAAGFYLVLFEKQSEPGAVPAPAEAAPQDGVTLQADDEIRFLKEQLAATVEQYEAANEELKASNEELQAMNEEMRSATEELETSKEELQSVNEELTTVNHELKANVEELSRTNADLNNLMASTDVGTIFLDRQLRIHRFTPAAQKIFNLIPSDMGRPLSDITSALRYDSFIQDAETVLRDLQTIEREVRVGDKDQWYLTRIAPYRTNEDRIAGVVATFVDITARKRAEQEFVAISQQLQAEVSRFNRIMASVPDFVYQFDLDGRFTYISQSLLDLWRKTFEEALGRNFHELDYPPELATKLQQQIDQVIETRRPLKDETPYTTASGTRMYEYLFFPLVAENGEIQGVGGVTRDITERKQAEQALRESEERFRTVADNVPQVIWTNDSEGNANYFNRRWYQYSGLSYDQSAGPGWQKIVNPGDEPASVQRWKEARARSEVFDCEYRLRRADGEYRWFIGRNVPLKDETGRVASWFGSATDIHDLKLAEAARRESEERYRLMVDGARDYAIFLLNPSNQVVYWSAGAERVFGWSAEEAIGQSGEIVFTPEDRTNEQEEKEIEIALRDGCASDRRWHVRKDGRRIWVDGVMRRLDDEHTGALRGFAKIARDATEQRRTEEALHRAHEELEQRVRDRTRELQAMNETLAEEMKRRHELEREILQVTERERARISQDLHDSLCQELTATAFLLKSRAKVARDDDPEAAESLEEAAERVNANAGLARDLARGLHPFELGSAGLPAALRELCSRSAPHVNCRCEAPRSMRMDDSIAVNLYRIAQEAVTNAIRHAQANEIVIALARNDGHTVLSVRDDGRAMSRKKAVKGMGIHLMTYRANVCGGTLEIDSGRGRGTIVRCRVPLKS